MAITIGTPSELGMKSEEVAAFYKNEWVRPIALGNMDFYRWQFIDVPHQEQKDSSCVAVSDGELVGVMGVNNRFFSMQNRVLNGAELTTWIVKESHRNKGIGPKMISYLQTKYDVLLGMGITEDALAVYLRNGFRYLRAIPRFIKVLDWEKIEPYAEYLPLAKKVDKYWSKQFVSCEYITEELDENSLKDITKNFYKESHLFSRDYEYMKWRYFDHPMFEYEVKVVYDKEYEDKGVIAVLREEISSEGLKILHVVDCFGDNKAMKAAISFILNRAKEKEVAIIDFFSAHSRVNSHFLESGWFSTLDDQFFKFPHLFQPLELREPATTSLIYWAKEDLASLCDLGKLYMTKQDCDFDRPVLEK